VQYCKVSKSRKPKERGGNSFSYVYNGTYISLRTSDHLVQLVKTLAPESEVLKNVSCNRTKATSIVKNVVGKYAL